MIAEDQKILIKNIDDLKFDKKDELKQFVLSIIQWLKKAKQK